MKKIIAIATFFIAAFPATSQAVATGTATQQVSLVVANAIAITFVSSGTATGASINMPFTTIANYSNGVTSAAQQLKVQSNNNFIVTVKTTSANFTYSGTTSPAPAMPVNGVLKLKVTANATGGTVVAPFTTTGYASLTSAAQNLINNGTNGGNQTFSVQYQATPGFAYPAGNYTTNVIYTATQE